MNFFFKWLFNLNRALSKPKNLIGEKDLQETLIAIFSGKSQKKTLHISLNGNSLLLSFNIIDIIRKKQQSKLKRCLYGRFLGPHTWYFDKATNGAKP